MNTSNKFIFSSDLRQQTSVVILAGGKGSRLGPLTRDRAKPAVPFGGVYRIIDFTLSNCLNSDLRKIHVLTQYKSASLDRHINNGWQNSFCRQLGEFIDLIGPQQRIGENWYQGTADAVYQNIYAIEKENPLYVLILAGDHIYKMDYRLMINRHIETGADITVGALVVPCDEAAGAFGVMDVDPVGRVLGFEEKPLTVRSLPGRPGLCLASMGIYVFTARALFEMLLNDANRIDSRHDFGANILPQAIDANRVFAWPFQDENNSPEAQPDPFFDLSNNQVADSQTTASKTSETTLNSGTHCTSVPISTLTQRRSYWRDVGQLDAYYDANMDLIAVEPQLNLYDDRWPIRTYRPNLPPAKFVFSEKQRHGWAMDSIVGPGTIVSGGEAQHCVLGHCVRLNSGALVRDSILFSEVNIGRGAELNRVIVDRGVHIPPGMKIGFDPEQDRAHGFHVTPHGVTVVTGRVQF